MTKSSKPELPPAILTIFGITGDLSKRKLLPSIYYLADDDMLPDSFKIVGVTRRGTTPAEVIESIRTAMKDRGESCHQATLARLQKAIVIVTMDITDKTEYVRLRTQLDALEDKANICLSRLYYLAMPSQMFMPVVRLLGEAGLNAGCQHAIAESRLMIEKPLGQDLSSATELITSIADSFSEHQLYLIDHYLAKEAVQRLLYSRLQSPKLDPIWNKDHVSHIVISADEAIGIEGRRTIYEQMGALRDVIQSHLIQLLSVVAMDQPADSSATAIHAAKLKLLDSVRPPSIETMGIQTVRGQYTGYLEEVGNPDSNVETFAAVKVHIDNERWQGVPIILRTGKKLAAKSTHINIVLKDPGRQNAINVLKIYIEPLPDVPADASNTTLIISCRDDYEQVLIGATKGDKTLFASPEEVLASWRIVNPIVESWARDIPKLDMYPVGFNGPEAFGRLLELHEREE